MAPNHYDDVEDDEEDDDSGDEAVGVPKKRRGAKKWKGESPGQAADRP